MDNHAGNLTISNNYIAGLIDSDFGIFINRFYPRGKLQLRPEIVFVNTNFDLIELCAEYLTINDINHHIRTLKATVGKPKKEVRLLRQSKCVEFADLMMKYCVVRRPQFEILKRFCESRLYHVRELGWKQNNTPYTDEQKEMYEEIVQLNLNYNYDNKFRNYTLAWLAGFIDGDGSICFVVTKDRSKGYCYDKIIPVIDITTGSDTARNNVTELFDKLTIKYQLRTTESKAKKRVGRNKKKFCYNIFVRNHDSLRKLLNLLDGKLVAKQRQLKLMLKYLELKKVSKFNTDEIWSIVESNRNLNKNR